jgi:hypothetical protein
MVTTASQHPWLLAGQWYRWPDPYDNNSGRLSRPVFQKYESSNFANEFLADPQKSLKFIEPDDLVQRTVRNAKGAYTLQTSNIRKLYLDTHKRFYLVVCELHCDVAGFPNANRDEVCDTGFVVRRRVPRIPKAIQPQARKTLEELARNRAALDELEALPPGMKAASLGIRATAEKAYLTAHRELLQTAELHGIGVELQGWIPEERAWRPVPETPQTITEDIFPLFPLIPDPRKKDHSSGGRTIWFGVVPVSSSDVDQHSNARFDDRSLYEIRCFVRRHDPRCPKRRERNHCKGAFVWSRRTESYQLASQFDLLGTSNRPVNIFLPDLPALEAQTALLQPGQGAPVRMIAPENSNLEATVADGDFGNIQKKTPGAAICSFSIPLITIVASFVFRIFLPIVTLVFGLWFLLRLKLCIPPSLELDAGVAADLDVALGKIELGISVDVAVDAGLFGDLAEAVDPTIGEKYKDFLSPLTKESTFGIAATQAVDFSASLPETISVDEPDPNAAKRPLPPAGSPIEYEERVEVKA